MPSLQEAFRFPGTGDVLKQAVHGRMPCSAEYGAEATDAKDETPASQVRAGAQPQRSSSRRYADAKKKAATAAKQPAARAVVEPGSPGRRQDKWRAR